MKRSLRIGVDVDGTVTEIIAPMVQFLREHGMEVPSYEETVDYNLGKIWGCSSEEGVRRVFMFYGSEEFRRLKPIHGVLEAFARLFPPHEACTITARPDFVEPVTRDFFDRHLAGYCKTMYHLGSYIKDGKTKGVLARELSLDIFVEDALHNAELCV